MSALRGRQPLIICAVAALYFVVARFSYAVAVLHGASSSLWAPAGVGVAAVVLAGRWVWPGVAAGEFAATLVQTHGHRPLVALAYGGGQAIEALTAAALLGRANFNPRLQRIRDVLWLLLPTAFGPTLIGATINALATVIGTATPWTSFWSVWRTAWLGDATGVILLAPVLLTAASHRPRLMHGLRGLESAAFIGVLCALIALTHFLPGGVAIALPPLLIWSALRFGPPGSALATAVMAGLGSEIGHQLSSQWHWLSAADRLLVTQDVFSIGSLATLVLAAALAERQRLLDAHDALGRFATAVASELPPQELIERLGSGGQALLGLPVAVAEGSGPPVDEVHTPVYVAGERWGWLTLPGLTQTASSRRFLHLETMLPRFAALLGVGIANTRARKALIDMARTDPLTGLANHRTFHERLADEMSRSRRYGRPVAVAMIDVDNFKVINDSVGHVGGDKVLATIAERVAGVMRNDALVARLGGDEIAVILPESSAHGAAIALQRARLAVSGSPVKPAGTVTLSAGICDSTFADTSEKIMELADDALYWSKLHGRDMAVTYSPDVVKPMTEDERMHRLTRTRALVGLKALAGMIDSRSSGYEQHSERVSTLVGKLGKAAGWPPDLIERLREAAAIHDVGKLTLDEGLITKPAPRTRIEEELWRQHPELSAQVTANVLDDEQIRWVRWHHERPDGQGYPDHLGAEDLPEGAALLGIANAWDRLIHGGPGQPGHSEAEALAICVTAEGTRFTSEAVAALRTVLAEDAQTAAEAAAERALSEDALDAQHRPVTAPPDA